MIGNVNRAAETSKFRIAKLRILSRIIVIVTQRITPVGDKLFVTFIHKFLGIHFAVLCVQVIDVAVVSFHGQHLR